MMNTANKILVALLLTSAIGQIKGYAQTAKGQDTPQSQTNATQPTHVIVDQVNTHPNEQETAKANAKEQREENRRVIEVRLAYTIACVTGIQAVIALLQWLIYKQQLKTSMPLVVIDWENAVHHAEKNRNLPQIEWSHYFNWGVRNIGNTPAFITHTSARFVVIPKGQGIPKMKYAPAKPFIQEPLLTKNSIDGDAINLWEKIEDTRPYPELEAAVRANEVTLYAFGYVRFRDRYGKRHKSTFCLRYYAQPTYDFTRDGFGYAGIKQNKYT